MTSHNCGMNSLYEEFNDVLNDFILNEKGFELIYNFTDNLYDCLNSGISFKDFQHDDRLYVHLLNVSILCGKIGRLFRFDNYTIYNLLLGGLLHDIGKYYIPTDILHSPGKLTRFQKIAIDTHQGIGKEIVSLFTDNEIIISMVGEHHSAINSIKAPITLIADNISKATLFPMICGIADITDAITSKRSYKEPLSDKVARNELYRKGIIDIDKVLNYALV